MKPLLYFAYGSNLDQAQMRKRCPRALGRFRARLPHHRIDFTHFSRRWGGGTADVVPAADCSVWGAVYELAREDLEELDSFEGGYERVIRTVVEDAGRSETVFTYTVRSKGSFPPTPAYLEALLRGGRAWGFPAEYLARLERLPL